MRGKALFRPGQEPEGEKPLVQGNMATVEDGPDANCESPTARRTPIPTADFSLRWSGCRLYGGESATDRAVRTVRPANRFQLSPRRLVIVVARMGQFGGKL